MGAENDHEVIYGTLTPADGGEINELFARAYGRSRTMEQWRWEFTGLPGNGPVLWGARAGRRLVGHYALIPVPMSFFGQALRSAKAESAMVDPDYRGRGICSRLVELTLQDARERSISTIWGFPNERSFRIMERSGRIHIGGLYGYIKILRRIRVFQAYLRRRWGRPGLSSAPAGVEVGTPEAGRVSSPDQPGGEKAPPAGGRIGPLPSVETPIDERFQRLWEGSRDRLGITIERSPEYLTWRFRDNPYGRYLIVAHGSGGGTLSGYMIATLKREGRLAIGYIVDFLCLEGRAEIFDGLLTETLNRLGAAGADMVVLFLNPAHPLCRPLVPVLERRRFHRRSRPKPFSIKIFPVEDEARQETPGDRRQRWHDIENWYLTGAFGEGVEY